MALFINGVGQDTFNMNGVSIDNLYVDGVLVWGLNTENTKPVISIIGDNPTQIIVYGQAYEELGATALDAEDGDISNDIVIGGDTPNVGVVGYYYVTYNVTDSGGLAADEAVRTVEVYAVTVPKYELTETLVNDGTFDYVPDSNNPNSYFQGKLTESDGTTPYLPTDLQYPGNGLLELDNGRIMDTQFTIDTVTDSYGLYGIYDADGSTVYKIWALDMDDLGSTGTLYEGDQDTPISLTSGITFNLDAGTLKITDGRPYWMPTDQLRTPVYMSIAGVTSGYPAPSGVTINEFLIGTNGTEQTSVDIDGNPADYTVTMNGSWQDGYGGSGLGTESQCVSDFELHTSQRAPTGTTRDLDVWLPEGTFDVTVGVAASTTEYDTEITFDGVVKNFEANVQDAQRCQTWTVTIGAGGETKNMVVTGTTIFGNAGSYGKVNTIRVTEVTA